MSLAPAPPEEATYLDEPVQEVPITSRQRLLPLLALCALTMGVGGYFALRKPAPSAPSDRAEQWEALHKEASLDLESLGEIGDVSGPVMLAYSHGIEPAQRYHFTQRSESGEEGAATTPGARSMMSFVGSHELRDVKEDPPRKDWGYTMSLSEVKIRIESPESVRGEPPVVLGEQVTDQLQKTIAASTLDVSRKETGAIGELSWRNRINKQVRPAMSLIQGGITLLAPVMPRERIVQGDTWYYDVELSGIEHEAMTFKGRVKVAATLRGVMTDARGRELHVIAQTLNVTSEGVTQGALKHTLIGEGSGVVLFDQEAGTVQRHRVELKTLLRLDVPGDDPTTNVESYYTFARSSSSPEVGE